MSAQEKAKGCIARALDERTPEAERFASAMRACFLINKYKLLDSPMDAVIPEEMRESVDAVSTIFSALTNPKTVAAAKKIAREFMRGGRRKRRYD